MTINDYLMIGAVILAPVIAVQVQKWLESWREKRERKINIFKTLMATRATRLDPSHVTALNMIDLEFEEQSVLEKWREYIDSLVDAPQIPSADATQEKKNNYQNDLKNWLDKNDNKFIELLYEMSRALKYKFDKVHLKKAIYHPTGFSDLELEQQLLRRMVLAFLDGQHAVKMDVTSFPGPDEKVEKVQAEIRKYLLDLMEGKKAIPVSMSPPKEQDREPPP